MNLLNIDRSVFLLWHVVCIMSQTSAAAVTDTSCTSADQTEGNKKCQAVDTNAECPANGDKCACKTGYIVDPDDNTKCLQIITEVGCDPNDQNNGHVKCQAVDSNSECSNDNSKCTCKEGYTGTNTCAKMPITAVGCTPADSEDTTCQGLDANSECSTSSSKCVCKTGYTGTDTCTKEAITEVGCSGNSGDTTCQGLDANSECSTTTSKCVCKTGYTGTATCTESQITDVSCTPGTIGDTTCQGLDANSECSTTISKCACKTGYTGTATCTKSPISQIDCTPGDESNGDTKCQGLDTNSECPSGAKKCACKTGYTGTDTCSKESSADTVNTSTAMAALSFLVMIVGRLL